MLALLAAAILTAVLIRTAADEPARRRRAEASELSALSLRLKRGAIDLDGAEDGAVLSRRAGLRELEEAFKAAVRRLRGVR